MAQPRQPIRGETSYAPGRNDGTTTTKPQGAKR